MEICLAKPYIWHSIYCTFAAESQNFTSTKISPAKAIRNLFYFQFFVFLTISGNSINFKPRWDECAHCYTLVPSCRKSNLLKDGKTFWSRKCYFFLPRRKSVVRADSTNAIHRFESRFIKHCKTRTDKNYNASAGHASRKKTWPVTP